MTTCNLAQAGFVAHLADEYLDGVLEKRPLAKPLIDACIVKLNEVSFMIKYVHLPLTNLGGANFGSRSPQQARGHLEDLNSGMPCYIALTSHYSISKISAFVWPFQMRLFLPEHG